MIPSVRVQDTIVNNDTHHKDNCQRHMDSINRRMARMGKLTERVSNLQESIVQKHVKYNICLKNNKLSKQQAGNRLHKYTKRAHNYTKRAHKSNTRSKSRYNYYKKSSRR